MSLFFPVKVAILSSGRFLRTTALLISATRDARFGRGGHVTGDWAVGCMLGMTSKRLGLATRCYAVVDFPIGIM